jgi:hypothetical protein
MDILTLLNLVSTLVPVAKSIVDALAGAKATPNPTNEILDIIATLTPVAAQLMQTLDTIRNQTQATYPQVWDKVRTDYASASAQFDLLNK